MSIEIPKFTVPGQPLCPILQNTKDSNVVNKFEPGNGAIFQEVVVNNKKTSIISSTLVGRVQVEEIVEEESKGNEEQEEEETKNKQSNDFSIKRFKISVIPNSKSEYDDFNNINKETTSTDFATNLPKEGDIVLSRVTKLNLRQAFVEILAVEGSGNVLTDSGIGSNGHGTLAPGGGSGAATFSIHQASSDLGETFKGIIRSQDVRSTDRDKVKIIESFKPGDIVRAQILSLGDGTNYYLTTSRNDLGVVYAKSHNGAGGLMYAIDWQTMVCAKTGELESRKCAKPF